ncbi:YkgJ family cysteine cluster protein [Candidatus Pacearchaeota archaeon]|nr:YkgJ family cysteine cluster protein [Candidatus Pacearchaeota archaeon]
MKQQIKIWNVDSKSDDKKVKVATIEQQDETEKYVPFCDNCSAPCCGDVVRPILTEIEFLEKKFPVYFFPLPAMMKKEGINADFLAAIPNIHDKCMYFDLKNRRCKIHNDRPKSCRSYDCRQDVRLIDFLKNRFSTK